MTFTEKYLRTPDPISVAGWQLKRYYVTMDDSPFDPVIEEAALAHLPRLLPTPDGDTPAAGFIVLHRGADGSAYLNSYCWVWDNVISNTNAAAGQPVIDCPDEDPTHFVTVTKPWIGCIWELPALGHERDAWVRHVFAPDVADVDAYLRDSLPEGPTGGPTTRRDQQME